MYVTDMACLLRDGNGAVEVIHDRHFLGLFPRTLWLELIAAAGFEPLAVPFAHTATPGARSFSGCDLSQTDDEDRTTPLSSR